MAITPKAKVQRRASGGDGVRGNVFELVTRTLNVAYYEWLPGSDELYFSPALLDLFGYDRGGTWTPKRSWEAIHRDDQPGYRAARIGYLKGDRDRAEFTCR